MEKKSIEQRSRLLINAVIIEENTAKLLRSMEDYSQRTFQHCLNVAFMAVQIGYNWGMQESKLKNLARGAALHDIGKMKIPIEILEKEGSLTQQEYDQVKMHPVYGHEVVKDLGYDEVVLDIILHHHEHIDGSGYPDGDRVMRMITETQIVAVMDAWDAMTSKRSYKPELSGQAAMQELLDFVESYYNREVIRGLRNITDK